MFQPLRLTLCAGIAAAGFFLSPAVSAKDCKTLILPAQQSVLSGDIGVNFISQYVARGLVFENQGFIAQPYADLYLKLYQGDGLINKVQLNFGFWGSIHSAKTFAPPHAKVSEWFEQDYAPGFTVAFAKNFAFTGAYSFYTSPSGAFDTTRALNARLDYNDTDLLGRFALHPHLTYLREVEKKVGNGIDQGNYYEFGIAPVLANLGPVIITLPASAGFGSNQFYRNNKSVGYVSSGLNLAAPIKCLPGNWIFNTGVNYLYMPGVVAAPNVIRGDNHNDFVFNCGIGTFF